MDIVMQAVGQVRGGRVAAEDDDWGASRARIVLDPTRFDNDALLAYSKQDPATGDTVVVIVSLDPHGPQEGTLHLDLPSLGFSWEDRVVAHDEVTGETYDWGPANYVRLDPNRAVAHVVSIQQKEA